ncbi:hypothetical protein MPTK2_7g07650 [Marchantia polymorpha subsp. ruderalis]
MTGVLLLMDSYHPVHCVLISLVQAHSSSLQLLAFVTKSQKKSPVIGSGKSVTPIDPPSHHGPHPPSSA